MESALSHSCCRNYPNYIPIVLCFRRLPSKSGLLLCIHLLLRWSCSARRKVSDAQDRAQFELTSLCVRKSPVSLVNPFLQKARNARQDSSYRKNIQLDESTDFARRSIKAGPPPLLRIAIQLTYYSQLTSIHFAPFSASLFSNCSNNPRTTGPCPHNTMRLALLRGTHPATTSGGRFLSATPAHLPGRLPTYRTETQESQRARSIPH